MFTKNNGESKRRFSLRGIFYASAAVLLVGAVSIFLFGFSDIDRSEDTAFSAHADELAEEMFGDRHYILQHEDLLAAVKNKQREAKLPKKKLVVIADGKITDIFSTENTVGAALAQAGIKLDEDDEVSPAPETPVTDAMNVTIVRVETKIVKEEQLMSFYEVNVPRDDMEKGYVNVVQEGDTGWAEATFSVTTRDGVVTDKVMLTQDVIVEPMAKIIEYGTCEARIVQTSRGGVRYKKVLQCNATAYDPSPASNGGYGGMTATGLPAKYGVIAVDPRVIPLGSRVYVESSDGGKSWVYGFAIAADTGGAIKGNKVDLCYNTRSECIQFGRRSATVYVLE